MRSLSEVRLSKNAEKVFKAIRDSWIKLPDIDFGVDDKNLVIIMTSHVLARAFGILFGLPVVDGLFLEYFDHSWIEFKTDEQSKPKYIIDVYPKGIMSIMRGPLLVEAFNRGTSGYMMYQENEERFGDSFKRPEFLTLVKKVEKELKKVI